MTASGRRPARFGRLLFWMRWGGALAAAAALTLLSLPGVAQADGPGYDPVTGVGPTASAKTVPWTQGILDSSNIPITSANADRSSSSPTSPLSFMYKDFQTLQVTVSQTQDIIHQGITVSWTGGKLTTGTFSADYLQMMECYGDATSGPNPEQCEYGSPNLAPNPQFSGIGGRTGDICATNSGPSTSNPPASKSGNNPPAGCDTLEPSDPTHVAPCPGPNCTPGTYTIPFAPVTVSDPTNPANLDYSADTTYYSQFNTDEVQAAVSNKDGNGQQQFETLTGVQASGLGCGQAEANGQPRGCWLVIVPRGEYQPNGFHINPLSFNSGLTTSPLAASNWAQRIQIHLDFAPVQAFCPLGTLQRQTIGTQLISRAMQSWQLALNHAANCTKVYGFTATSEPATTDQFSNNPASDTSAGLAFTTIPIGSEVTRESSGSPPTLPSILYAPVAVSALDFGFNINYGTAGYITTPIKLTPELLAEALTQSYREDLPDYYPDITGHPGPTWSQGNPFNISVDPRFITLNNSQAFADPSGPIAPLLTVDRTALNQQVWQWIQGDSASSGWLDGTPGAGDPNVKVDPDYQALNLGTGTAIDSYPRAYTGVLNLPDFPGPPPKPETKNTGNLLPYTDNFDSAAVAVLTANNPDESGPFAEAYIGPDGTPGWWGKAGTELLGSTFMWAADDTSNLAAYGLIPAQLCNDAGTSCIGPSTASLTAALLTAKPDSSGLLHIDPAQPGTNGYPLVDITYAAVRTDSSPAALNDYAALIAYAAGQGQAIGAVAGDLPPGYLPMPANLQSQAQAVVTKLQALASGSPSPSPSASQSPTTGATTSTGPPQGGNATTPAATTGTGTPGTGSTGGGATPRPTSGITPTAGTTPTLAGLPSLSPNCSPSPSHSPSPSRTPTPSCSPSPAGAISPGGPVTSLPPAEPVAGTTPAAVVGAIRWVLIAVVIAGTVCAAAGTLLRSGHLPPWLRPSSGQTPPWLRRRKLDS